MSPIQVLRTLAKAGNVDEVRQYLAENEAEIMRVVPGLVTDARDTDDADLCRHVLAKCKRANVDAREASRRAATDEASSYGNSVGFAAQWFGDCAKVAIGAILDHCLVGDRLVFTCDEWTVSAPVAVLKRLRALRKRNLAAYVDASGLHVRWGIGRGIDLANKPRDVRETWTVIPLAARECAEVAA